MEQVPGIEPRSQAWKARVMTVIRYLLVAATGNSEIPTLELTAPCSASELRRILCDPDRIRTCDSLIKSEVL